MIDRHRSLIHMLMSGLVGLTLGLFIGWWVWPVQWTGAPAAQPAASAPAQAVERPAEEGEETDSTYSTFLDFLNQGLLYVAAALLLVGGIVIGYQLLRQSDDKESAVKPFPLPFIRSRSKQAAAPHEPRAKPPPLAGRPVRQRPSNLSWLRRGPTSERLADTEEPVFKDQEVAARRPVEPPPPSLHLESETEHQGSRGNEVDHASIQDDDYLEPESWGDQVSVGEDSPSEPPAAEEPGPDSPALHGAPETATPELQEGGTELIGKHLDAGQDDWIREESFGGEDAGEWGEERQLDGTPVLSEGLESVEGRDSEDRELWEEDLRTASAEASFPDDANSEKAGPGGAIEGIVAEEAAAGPERPFERPDRDLNAGPPSRLEPGIGDTGRGLTEQANVAQTSRQLLGQFEANYAFGVQSYDESFTINAADGELLGACGMGINESMDRAAADMDQVRLLDIWLYDRSAVRSVSQPLVSPGHEVSGLDDHAEDGGSVTAAPLEIVPGLTCTLRSNGILLECTIKSASFLDNGQTPAPFRSVSASLVVYVLS